MKLTPAGFAQRRGATGIYVPLPSTLTIQTPDRDNLLYNFGRDPRSLEICMNFWE